jgi:putative ABC transport system permease protein
LSTIDFKYCVRALCRTPLSTAAIVLTLAIGIGGSTAIFAVVDAMLLKTLPFPHPDELIAVNEVDLRSGNYVAATVPGFLAYSEALQSIGLMAGYRHQSFGIAGSGQAELVPGAPVSGGFFKFLGISPFVGRTFGESDPDGTIVLSFAYWQTHFHGDTSIVGKPLMLDGAPAMVIGVMGPGFQYPEMQCRVWRLINRDYPNYRFFRMFGRLRDASWRTRARAQLEVVRSRRAQERPDVYKDIGIAVVPLKEDMVGTSQPVLMAVSVFASLVLLMACVNTAILQIACSVSRSKELAIRSAIGASPGQIARVLFFESAMMSLAGTALGLLLASASLRLTVTFSPFRMPRSGEIRIDAPALFVTVLLLILTSIASGLFPAAGAMKPVFHALNARNSLSQRMRWTMSLLAMVEVGAATILLSASFLAIQSFVRLASVNIGFPSEGLLTVALRLQKPNYPNRAALDSFQSKIYRRIGAIPGVKECAGSTHVPLLSGFVNLVSIRDSAEASSTDRELAGQSAVSPGYFHAMGIRLLGGREFSDFDHAGSERVAIVNESMARLYWPKQSALGKQVRSGAPRESNPWYTVVGVVSDIRHFGLAAQPRPTIFLHFSQLAPAFEQTLGRTTALAIRTSIDPSALVAPIRKALAEIDADLPSEIRPMNDIISESLAPQKFPTVVVAVFASIALWLSGLGLYVVMATVAAKRMPEMGIRMALGATRVSVVTLMLRSALTLVSVGLVVGIVGALLLSRSWRSILPDASVMNPWAIVCTALLLIVTSAFAAFWPARKAASADPASVIRSE